MEREVLGALNVAHDEDDMRSEVQLFLIHPWKGSDGCMDSSVHTAGCERQVNTWSRSRPIVCSWSQCTNVNGTCIGAIM